MTAVAAELAAHIHQLFLEHRQLDTQMIVFDVLTETSNEEECVFWPGTGSEYASLVGVVVPAVKSKLGATPQVCCYFASATAILPVLLLLLHFYCYCYTAAATTLLILPLPHC